MIIEKAFLELYPEERLGKYDFSLKYSEQLSSYNGNVRRRGNHIHFHLSKKWKTIDEDIQMGLIQLLFNKLFRTKKETRNMELYSLFLKKVHVAIPKTKTDNILEASYERVNQKYFHGLIEKPNVEWGSSSMRTLGRYEYGTDTIRISTLFREDSELLDYIMHHELLHKKHKFYTKNGRSYHHTREFLGEERKFEDFSGMEKRIKTLVGQKKRYFGFF